MGDREVLLVEPATPFEDEQRAWLDWARGQVSQGRTLRAVFLTHEHEDHVGGVPRLAEALGLPLWSHALTAQRLGIGVARTLADGDVITLDGPVPQSWQVLHTPGHARGHLCLWEAELRAVVVGDMVASQGTILIEPHDGDMAEYLRQLERLAHLDAEIALPAHGGAIASPTTLFRHYIAHRLAREQKVKDALAPGAASLDDLLPRVYGDVAAHVFPIARLSLEAHLVKLVAEGVVEKTGGRYHLATDAVGRGIRGDGGAPG